LRELIDDIDTEKVTNEETIKIKKEL